MGILAHVVVATGDFWHKNDSFESNNSRNSGVLILVILGQRG